MKPILIGFGGVAAILLLSGGWFLHSSQKAHGDYHKCQENREALDIARYWYALDNGMTNAPGLAAKELAPYVQDQKTFACPHGGVYSVNAQSLHVGCSIAEHMFESCLGNPRPPQALSNWLQDYPLNYRTSDTWWYSRDETKDGTTFRMSGATIIFKGLHGWGGGWGTMAISGSGTSRGSSGSRDRIVTDSYAGGVYIANIAGHVVRVTNRGGSLEIDKSTFDVTRGRPRIVVSTNGASQAEARENAAAEP